MNLEYEIVYSDRRSIAITVERDRRVVVRAPRHARAEAIALIVERKRFWIWGKLRDPQKYNLPARKKEFVAGETFLFLGANHSLELVNTPRGEVRLNGYRFELARTDQKSGRDLFYRWYLSSAKRLIAPRVESAAKAMGVEFRRVAIRDLKYSWGSCSWGKSLTFNWRIVQAPSVVIDYLIGHELAHLLEPNHSAAFWNIVAVQVPAWEEARDWLRQHGPLLEW